MLQIQVKPALFLSSNVIIWHTCFCLLIYGKPVLEYAGSMSTMKRNEYLDGYTDTELRAMYRFSRDSRNFITITTLIRNTIERPTNRSRDCTQILCIWKLYAGDRRHVWSGQMCKPFAITKVHLSSHYSHDTLEVDNI